MLALFCIGALCFALAPEGLVLFLSNSCIYIRGYPGTGTLQLLQETAWYLP